MDAATAAQAGDYTACRMAMAQELLSLEAAGPGQPILPEILARGWAMVAEQPKYGASPALGRQALYPFVHYCLFRRP